MIYQSPEQLIYRGQTYDLSGKPDVPVIDGKIAERIDPFSDKTGAQSSTARRRGYIGVWEIRENQLFLKDIAGRYEKLCEEDIFAHWVSRSLKIETGPYIPTKYGMMSSLPSLEMSIKIEKGVILSSSTQNNELLCKQIVSTAKHAVIDAKREIASRQFNISSYFEKFLPSRKKVRSSALLKDRSDTLLKHMRKNNSLLMSRSGALYLFDCVIDVDALWHDPEFSIAKKIEREREAILAVFKDDKPQPP